MTVLALTWIGYIKIIGGAVIATAIAIAAIGDAQRYLKDWLRNGISLAQRLWRFLRHTPAGQAAGGGEDEHAKEPTVEQVRVLNVVYQYFLEHGKPAPFWAIDKLLDREGLPLRPHAESMPHGLLMPDVARRGGFIRPEDELMVTVDGLRYCEGGMATLDRLAHVLAFMAKLEKAFMPTSSDPKLVVQAAEVKKALGLPPVELEQAYLLIDQFESGTWTGATPGANGDWSFTLNLEGIRRFRGIRDGAEYLLARAGTQSFAHRLAEEEAAARRPQFTLVGNNVPASAFGSGPICLRVENEGPTDEFEAAVIAVQGAAKALPPWYVRCDAHGIAGRRS